MLEPKIVTERIKCKVYTNNDYGQFFKRIPRDQNNDSEEDLPSHDNETVI